jgi:Repeat of unknown function (DUF5650)
VSADGLVRSQDVTVGGRLLILAPTVGVGGSLRADEVTLDISGFVTVEAGALLTANQIDVSASVFVNSGQLRADGLAGGQVFVSAGNVQNGGRVSANGSGAGGTVRIAFTGSYVDTRAAVTSASGLAGAGGSVTIDGGAMGHLFSSGRQEATGSVGGHVDLFGREVELVGATVDTSGEAGGGGARIGGDFHGGMVGQVANLPGLDGHVGTLPHVNAVTVMAAATTIHADARGGGDGGRVVDWADQNTTFDGAVTARGGPADGDGGFVEVSGLGNLKYGGAADTGAPAGKAGTLLLDPKNLVIDAVAGALPQFNFVDPHPTTGAHFGASVTVLSGGNVVVTNPSDNFGGSNAGAVYLYDGLTGALLSSLVGSTANDQVGGGTGGGITALSNGNYVVQSPSWNGSRGAATWGSGTAGVTGAVSASNSLIGSLASDNVGYYGVIVLTNGNYVVLSTAWDAFRGAVTWGSSTTGVSGVVSVSNSLTCTSDNDRVGNNGVTLLSNGNYVVDSANWNGNVGAVTWGSGTAGVKGAVSATNSLIGSSALDYVGGNGVTTLSNGNYVVDSANWNHVGAVTLGSGTAGVTGVVSASNSLIGSSDGDLVGRLGVLALSNGNYVVRSPDWNGHVGAATWGSGTSGVSGPVSPSNSLVGSSPNPCCAPAGFWENRQESTQTRNFGERQSR